MKTISKPFKQVLKLCIMFNFLIALMGLFVLRESLSLTGADEKRSPSGRYGRSKNTESESKDHMITSLVGLPTNFNFSRKGAAQRHKILWYNKPPWKSVHKQNAYLPRCEVNNCFVTDDINDVNTASAIIFVPSIEGMGNTPPVSRVERDTKQVWIFYSLEPPVNFRYQEYRSPGWRNTMNWSMTYRFGSDIFAPYGTFRLKRRIPKRDYRQLFLQKTKMVSWVVSHCGAESQRDIYVRELERHGVSVDIFGKCGNSGFMKDANMDEELNKYKFFIAFENSFCKEYISCKVFRKYNLDLILVVRGGANYTTLMPRGTYINTDDFSSVKELAHFLLKLSKDQVQYIRMLKKKDKYEALDEDEFGEKFAMCELCRKLNNVEKYRRSYISLTDFVEARQCWHPTDLPENLTKSHVPRNNRMYIE